MEVLTTKDMNRLSKELKRLSSVEDVYGAMGDLHVLYHRFTKATGFKDNLKCNLGELHISTNGKIKYMNKDVRPTHDLRHFLQVVLRKKLSHLTFGQALEWMKSGYKIARASWGGYWYIDRYFFSPKSSSLSWMIVAHLKDGSYAPAQPYQCDLLADDWRVIGKEDTFEEHI